MPRVEFPYMSVIVGGHNLDETPNRYYQGIDIERTSEQAGKFTIKLVYVPETFSKGDANKIDRILSAMEHTTEEYKVGSSTITDYVTSDVISDKDLQVSTYNSSTVTKIEAGVKITIKYGWNSSQYIKVEGFYYDYTSAVTENGTVTYTITGVGKTTAFNITNTVFPAVTFDKCPGGRYTGYLKQLLEEYFNPLGFNVFVVQDDVTFTEATYKDIPQYEGTLYDYLFGDEANLKTSGETTSVVQSQTGLLNLCRAKQINITPLDMSGVLDGTMTIVEYVRKVKKHAEEQTELQKQNGYTESGYPYTLVIDDLSTPPTVTAVPDYSGSTGRITTFCFGNNQLNNVVIDFSTDFQGAMAITAINADNSAVATTELDDATGEEIVGIKRTNSGQGLGSIEAMSAADAAKTAKISRASNYAYTAELTTRGHINSLKLHNVIDVIPLVNGSTHHTAGTYEIYEIKDSLDNRGTYTTRYKLHRVVGDWNTFNLGHSKYTQAVEAISNHTNSGSV